MDCCSQLKSQLSKSAGNMATASNSLPCLELGPSPSELVDKTGSRGKIWNYFADRADENKYPVGILQSLSKSCYTAPKIRCGNKILVVKKCDNLAMHLSDSCTGMLLSYNVCVCLGIVAGLCYIYKIYCLAMQYHNFTHVIWQS